MVRHTPEQYAAVAAAGGPPRAGEPRFVGILNLLRRGLDASQRHSSSASSSPGPLEWVRVVPTATRPSASSVKTEASS